MTSVLLYDGTFEGLLTAIFEVYEYKLEQPSICVPGLATGSLFGPSREVLTDLAKAERVYKKLQEQLSKNSLQQLRACFLSEVKDMENILLRYIQYVLQTGGQNNFSHPDVLKVLQISKKVAKEKHRMEAFVRFQLTKDGLYYAIVQPDHNVLPLIARHFRDRYADQRWLIYDASRKYGLYYDREKVEEVKINFSEQAVLNGITSECCDESENLYQQLWQQYFSSVNIAARKNIKLHLQHMPRRYWKYLPEKAVKK